MTTPLIVIVPTDVVPWTRIVSVQLANNPGSHTIANVRSIPGVTAYIVNDSLSKICHQ